MRYNAHLNGKCMAPTYHTPFSTLVCHEDRLKLPTQWKQPSKIFVDSMSDLFHEDVPDEFIAKVFNVMLTANHHTYQVLTKREDRMRSWVNQFVQSNQGSLGVSDVLPRHIWLGVSVELQKYVHRIHVLQQVAAQIRFVSIEPLLGPLQLDAPDLAGIHWVIVGGESVATYVKNTIARPMHAEWVAAIHQACQTNGVPFFFKQWGDHDCNGVWMRKKKTGRLFLGRDVVL